MNCCEHLRKQIAGDFRPAIATCPMLAMPGSADKIRIMAGRINRGEELHSDGDANCLPEYVPANSHAISSGVVYPAGVGADG